MKNIASRDNSFTRFWFLTVDRECSMKVNQEHVSSIVETVLLDSSGWASHGYTFVRIPCEEGLALRRKNPNSRRAIFHLKVSTDENISQECGFAGLSCADMSVNVIYINMDRWLLGAKQSGLSLIDYRYYLIQHEIGHLLGRSHTRCPSDGHPRPIMVQATVANDTCLPNKWPLLTE